MEYDLINRKRENVYRLSVQKYFKANLAQHTYPDHYRFNCQSYQQWISPG